MSRHTTLKAPALSLGATSPGGSSVAGASPRGPALSAVELLAAAASTWSSSGGSPFSLASASSNSKSPLVLSFQNGHHHHHYDGGNHIVCERCLLACCSRPVHLLIRYDLLRFDSIRFDDLWYLTQGGSEASSSSSSNPISRLLAPGAFRDLAHRYTHSLEALSLSLSLIEPRTSNLTRSLLGYVPAWLCMLSLGTNERRCTLAAKHNRCRSCCRSST